MFPATTTEEIAQLRDRIRVLETRLDRLEQRGPSPVVQLESATPRPTDDAPAPIDTEIAAATIFTRIAMLCFVLLGALILRVLTQQNIFAASFGTILGFAYAGHLIVLSLLPGRWGGLVRDSSVFQCSGAVLAFFIAIESALRTLTMGRVSAMMTMAGFALLALGMGIREGKAALAGVGIIGGILSLVALDMRGATVPLQLALVVMLGAVGLANSWREGWQWLRPTTTWLLALLLPAGFFFCGKEPGVGTGLLVASTGVWCLAMLQHVMAFNRLRRAAAWLPLLTLWLAGIQQVARWPLAGPTMGGIAAFALVCVILHAHRNTQGTAGLAGMMATSALAGAIGWALLDRTGLLCVLGGMALWWGGRRAAPDWAALLSTLLMLAAAGIGLGQLLRPPVPIHGLIAMAVSAMLLVFHYVRNSRPDLEETPELPMRLAPIALAAGLALLLGLFWDVLNRVFDQPVRLLLSQTILLVMTALALTFWGHATHRRSPLFCGLSCMALALAKVLLVDLVRLKSFSMLASLVLVSLASVAISVILRRRRGSIAGAGHRVGLGQSQPE